MTAAHTVYVDGVALWSPTLPGWRLARAALAGDAPPPAGDVAAESTAPRPAPALLAANERRRAPDTVLLALEVASHALAASGHAAADVASVFASTHGDLPITDALCRTLAQNPLLLSPTRFHHSVHNAASGYWAIGSGSMAASTALSAFDSTWAAGLLEAACQCSAEQQPVLLAAYDTQAVGPLASVNTSRGLLAVALVLAPQAGPASRWALTWSLVTGGGLAPATHSDAAKALAANAMAGALPLMEALAAGGGTTLCWPLSPTLGLQITLLALPHAP
jgi:hypothetical protein